MERRFDAAVIFYSENLGIGIDRTCRRGFHTGHMRHPLDVEDEKVVFFYIRNKLGYTTK